MPELLPEPCHLVHARAEMPEGLWKLCGRWGWGWRPLGASRWSVSIDRCGESSYRCGPASKLRAGELPHVSRCVPAGLWEMAKAPGLP